jgi:hypothetical protein
MNATNNYSFKYITLWNSILFKNLGITVATQNLTRVITWVTTQVIPEHVTQSFTQVLPRHVPDRVNPALPECLSGLVKSYPITDPVLPEAYPAG